MRKKIVAISGSVRKNSANEIILKFIADKYRAHLDIEIYSRLNELPYFNPDIDDTMISPVVKEFRQRIDSANGVLICTPEYVFSLPGILKNAIEWTVSTVVFSEKPVALITASASGEKAHESLNLIMRTLYGRVSEETSLLIKGAKGKIKEGVITDQNLLNQLDSLMQAFIKSLDA